MSGRLFGHAFGGVIRPPLYQRSGKAGVSLFPLLRHLLFMRRGRGPPPLYQRSGKAGVSLFPLLRHLLFMRRGRGPHHLSTNVVVWHTCHVFPSSTEEGKSTNVKMRT